MSKLISILGVLALASVMGGTLADDGVKAGGKTNETHGRALDEIKAGGKTNETHGRALDEIKAGGKTNETHGRAVEEDKAKN